MGRSSGDRRVGFMLLLYRGVVVMAAAGGKFIVVALLIKDPSNEHICNQIMSMSITEHPITKPNIKNNSIF